MRKQTKLLVGLLLLLIAIVMPVVIAGWFQTIDYMAGTGQYLLWMGIGMAVVGFTLITTTFLDNKIIGDFKLKLFGQELPLLVEGQIMVLLVFSALAGLVVGFSNIHRQYDFLSDLNEERGKGLALNEKYTLADEKRGIYRAILAGDHLKEIKVMQFSIKCGDDETENLTEWKRFRADNKQEITDTNLVPLSVGEKVTGYSLDNGPTRVAYAQFWFQGGIIVGSLKVNDFDGLRDLCDSKRRRPGYVPQIIDETNDGTIAGEELLKENG